VKIFETIKDKLSPYVAEILIAEYILLWVIILMLDA